MRKNEVMEFNMMDVVLVSVVVPVYNVENYLDKCLSSIVNQSYSNLEIILVDDGSMDRSAQICDDWAQKDGRIKVVHKKNAGAGLARNTGIENATGKYICFFDSDDYIEHNTIEMCCEVMNKQKADIVCFGSNRVTQSGKVIDARIPCAPKSVFRGEEIKSVLLPKLISYDPVSGENWNLTLGPWAAFYAMEIIRDNSWRFVSEREYFSEDYYSLLQLYGYAERIVLLPIILYHYVVNPSSLTQVYKNDRYERIKCFYHQLSALCSRMGIGDYTDNEVAALYLGHVIGCFKQIVSGQAPLVVKLNKFNTIVKDPFLNKVLSESNFSGDKREKKILWSAMKNQNIFLCYIIVMLRNFKGKLKQWV